jgi:hypothetical protein
LAKLFNENDNPSISEVVVEKPLFFAQTFDIRLCENKWKIISNYLNNLNSYSRPFYKLGTKEDARLVNYYGEFIRQISPDEFEELSYKSTISEVGLEAAINGYFKLDTWYDSDKKYLYEYVLKSNLIAKK